MFWFRYCAIYSTNKKKKRQSKKTPTLGHLEKWFFLLSCRVLACTVELGEFKVSLLLLCGYLVSQCKPL